MTISVLVADDSPTIRRRAQATLGEAGFDVHCVEDGAAAWQELESGRKADVLLCDILMPKLDGYELCGRVKGDPRFANVPVLLLRGTFEPWDESRAHEAGADGFITKPFEPDNLVGTVRDVLESAGEDEEQPDFDGDTVLSPAEPPEAFEPEPVAEPEPEPEPAFEPEPAAAAPIEDESPFGATEAAADPFGSDDDPLALGDQAPAAAAPAPAAPAAPAAAPAPVAAASSALTGGSLDDAALDALAAKVAAKLAGDVLEKLAWEVVPEVAEALIRKRMVEIESKLQGG